MPLVPCAGACQAAACGIRRPTATAAAAAAAAAATAAADHSLWVTAPALFRLAAGRSAAQLNSLHSTALLCTALLHGVALHCAAQNVHSTALDGSARHGSALHSVALRTGAAMMAWSSSGPGMSRSRCLLGRAAMINNIDPMIVMRDILFMRCI